jgi:hypothetical protein
VTKHTGLGNGELGNAITTHRRKYLEKVLMLGDLLLGTLPNLPNPKRTTSLAKVDNTCSI